MHRNRCCISFLIKAGGLEKRAFYVLFPAVTLKKTNGIQPQFPAHVNLSQLTWKQKSRRYLRSTRSGASRHQVVLMQQKSIQSSKLENPRTSVEEKSLNSR